MGQSALYQPQHGCAIEAQPPSPLVDYVDEIHDAGFMRLSVPRLGLVRLREAESIELGND